MHVVFEFGILLANLVCFALQVKATIIFGVSVAMHAINHSICDLFTVCVSLLAINLSICILFSVSVAMHAIVVVVSNLILFDISLHVSVGVLLALTLSVTDQDPVSFFVSVTICCSKLLFLCIALAIKIWCAMPISVSSANSKRKSLHEFHALQHHCHTNNVTVLNSECFVFSDSNSLSMPTTQLLG
jgi:hypothetical protein